MEAVFSDWSRLIVDPVFLLDIDGVIVASNRPGLRMVDGAQLVGRPFRDLVDDPTEADRMLERFAGAADPLPGALGFDGVRRRVRGLTIGGGDSSRRRRIVVQVLEHDETLDGWRFRSLTRTVQQLEQEIGRRREAEQRLRRRTETLRAVLDNTTVGVYTKDLEGRYVMVNEAAAHAFGLPDATALIGKSDAEIFAPETAAPIRAADLEVIRSAMPVTVEEQAQVGDQVRTFLSVKVPMRNVDGTVHGVAGVSTDVTERAVAEAMLRQRTSQLAEAHRIARIGDWRIDPVSGSFDLSAELCEILGLPSDVELTADSLLSRVHPDDVAVVEQDVSDVLVARAVDGVARWVRPDSRVVWMRIRSDGATDVHGWVVGTVQDVSDQIEADVQRGELEARLQQSQRLEALGQLAGGIAHDFNNLLAVAQLHAELARSELGRPGSADEHLAQVGEAIDRASELTRRLLLFSRQEAPNPTLLDVNLLIRDVFSLLRRTLGEHIRLVDELARDVPHIRFDRSQIEQVLVNLAVNARDAMPDGGVLTVSTDLVELDDAAAAQWPQLDAGRYVELAITDTGHGMDEATARHAFEPFFTTKFDSGGSGLGLATVHGVVAAAGGEVRIMSSLGIGTSVALLIPAVADLDAANLDTGDLDAADVGTRTAATQTDDAVADAGDGAGDPDVPRELVLVVEDREDLGRLVVRLLERLGFRALLATDGSDALDLIRANDDIDLVISDVLMPNVSGTVMAAEIARDHPHLPVVFMSGFTDGQVTEYPYESGSSVGSAPVLAKPFSMDDLRDFVEAALARRPA